MTKEYIIFGVPLLITLAYIIYRIIVNIKEDGVFDFLFIHIATRKYRITPNRPRKIARKKIKRIPLIFLFLINGLFILISSYILYKGVFLHQVLPVAKQAVKSFDPSMPPLLMSVQESAAPSFDDVYDKITKILGTLSTATGVYLGLKEIISRKKINKKHS